MRVQHDRGRAFALGASRHASIAAVGAAAPIAAFRGRVELASVRTSVCIYAGEKGHVACLSETFKSWVLVVTMSHMHA
jgi:hypothetical protein